MDFSLYLIRFPVNDFSLNDVKSSTCSVKIFSTLPTVLYTKVLCASRIFLYLSIFMMLYVHKLISFSGRPFLPSIQSFDDCNSFVVLFNSFFYFIWLEGPCYGFLAVFNLFSGQWLLYNFLCEITTSLNWFSWKSITQYSNNLERNRRSIKKLRLTFPQKLNM